MDVLVALLAPGASDWLPAELDLMLGALWPTTERVTATYQASGLLLAISRTRVATAGVGPPRIHQAGSRRLVRFFDWPCLTPHPHRPWPAPVGELPDPPPETPPTIVWDPERATLTAVRDALGEGPIWIAKAPGRLAIASHPAMLLALPWVSSGPDPVGQAAIEVRIPQLPEESRWRDLRRLPPGHLLVARDGAIEIRRWWRGLPTATGKERSDPEWFAQVRTALETAVARRIPARGTVGAHLSGGLDSTAVTLLAARALASHDRMLHTFSHVPPVPWNPPQAGDETPFVRAALAHLPNAIPHLVTGAGHAPSTSPTAYQPHDIEVRDQAREAEVLCLLSGWGGDEGVSYNGDGFLSGELLRGRIRSVLQWCRRFGGGTARGVVRSLYYKAVLQSFGALRPVAGYSRIRKQELAHLAPDVRDLLWQRHRVRRGLRSAPSAHTNQRRLLASAHIANRMDRDAESGLPAGFCFRYPLLDLELLTAVLQAPERLSVIGGETRTLLRQAMLGLYPEAIQQRRGKFVSHPERLRVAPIDGA